MIAMPLALQNVGESSVAQEAVVPTPFPPLDPAILDASIPAFYIGRNSDGFWLARGTRGEIGGIFLLKSSALAFTRRVSRRTGCATIFSSERFELDVENRGNPLVPWLRPLRRFVTRVWSL